jgi:hypothetical protein
MRVILLVLNIQSKQEVKRCRLVNDPNRMTESGTRQHQRGFAAPVIRFRSILDGGFSSIRFSSNRPIKSRWTIDLAFSMDHLTSSSIPCKPICQSSAIFHILWEHLSQPQANPDGAV